jgi:hypothetical protein
MNINKALIIPFAVGCLLVGCTAQQKDPVLETEVKHPIEFNPESYVCDQAISPVVIDGDLSDQAWQQASWSNSFVDIEGELKPEPIKDTKIKMLWDSTYFYIAAELKEDHIWGNITKHDAVIYFDNDFEVFIDPDGDTHKYYEFEINALGTTWDLLLTEPYRDNGMAMNSWEIPGMISAVKIDGTINDPSDIDDKWTVELAFPWKVLNECSGNAKMPKEGTQWRINFSRVQWLTEVVNGKYVKLKDANGKRLPENNWVWSPQGKIAMHRPETWGYVQFSSASEAVAFKKEADEDVKWALRQVYYREKAYFENYNFYTSDVEALALSEVLLNGNKFQPQIQIHEGGFVATYPSITQEGKIWVIETDGKVFLKKN